MDTLIEPEEGYEFDDVITPDDPKDHLSAEASKGNNSKRRPGSGIEGLLSESLNSQQ
jgi:hypothetical protein